MFLYVEKETETRSFETFLSASCLILDISFLKRDATHVPNVMCKIRGPVAATTFLARLTKCPHRIRGETAKSPHYDPDKGKLIPNQIESCGSCHVMRTITDKC